MENIYPSGVVAEIMSRRVVAVTSLLLLVPVMALIPTVSAQGVLPSVTLECTDSVEIDVSSSSSGSTLISCEVENDSMWDEEISIDVEFEELGGTYEDSLEIAAGESEIFMITVTAQQSDEAGDYLVNVSADVTTAAGIPVTGMASDSDEVDVTISEFTTCDHSVGQGGGTIEAGEIVTFSVSISCDSNTDSSTSYDAVMIDKSGSSAWPGGFDDQSPPCDVMIPDGGTSENCQFTLLTPSNLANTWDGCVVVVRSGESTPNSCPGSNLIDLTVEPKSVGIGTLELTGNNSIFGDYEEEAPVIIGGVAVVLVLTIAVVVIRRRRNSFDD
ncbi:MAG: hypothetical protein VYD62_04450 [Candidatus Thermoplasmatota archaeon]|nr:hypothetical protein [Candidatus Thermoplasmatota archaeon]